MNKINFEISGVKLGVGIIRDIKVEKSLKDLELFEKEIFEKVRKTWGERDLVKDRILKSFRDLFWSFDMDPTKTRPSAEALIKRILRENNLWRINTIVDAMNLASAEYGLPIGLYDLDKLVGDITVRTAKEKEVFVKIGGKKMESEGNEIVVGDEEKLISLGYSYSDSNLTKIDKKTKNILVLVYATNELKDSYLMKCLDTTLEYITRFNSGKITEKRIVKSTITPRITRKGEKEMVESKEKISLDKGDLLGITVKKGKDFSEWYTQVVLKSKLADYAAMKGFIVFMPYGYAIWEKIMEFLDGELKKMSHKNAYFPALIPESFLKKEAEHFTGFTPETFVVTHSGKRKLSERLVVRPTSETIAYDSYAKWIRSWRDLPLLLNFWNSVLRAEIKATKPFLRTSEFLWQEGHTVHATNEEAREEVMKILHLYKRLIEDYLAIPVLIGKKSKMEKFAGAFYTTTLEALMPDGKALQAGTSHNLGQNFAKAFDIKFLDKDGKQKYVWQTSWAVTTRLIGAVVMVHGDDRGLVLPPKIAPIHVVIVPISFEDDRKILERSREIKTTLEKGGNSVELDDRDEYTPGWKFNEWELKGVPLRIEIGPKEIESKQVTLVRRDTGEKTTIKQTNLVKEVSSELEQIQKNLFNRARKFLENNITIVKDYREFKKTLEEKGGFVRACWCLDSECEEKIKEDTGATVRIIPFKKEKIFSKCIRCGKEAKEVVYFAKAY